jgi:hypothetical protein
LDQISKPTRKTAQSICDVGNIPFRPRISNVSRAPSPFAINRQDSLPSDRRAFCPRHRRELGECPARRSFPLSCSRPGLGTRGGSLCCRMKRVLVRDIYRPSLTCGFPEEFVRMQASYILILLHIAFPNTVTFALIASSAFEDNFLLRVVKDSGRKKSLLEAPSATEQRICNIAHPRIKHMFVLNLFPCKYLVRVQWSGYLCSVGVREICAIAAI